MTVIPSQIEIEQATIGNMLSDLHTCMPGEVVAVRASADDKRQFVDVLPMLKRAVIDEDGEPRDEALPLLQMVPVGYMQGGGFFLSVPLRVGDVVLLVFAERSLDSWIQTASPGARTPATPGDLSTHTLQGAIALPYGPRPRAALLVGVDAGDMVVGTESGTILARFKGDGSVVFAEGINFVALANLVAIELARLQADLTTLKAAVQVGFNTVYPSGPAAGATQGSAAAGAFAAAFSPTSPGSVAATKTKAT
jgi:hypothetical protein